MWCSLNDVEGVIVYINTTVYSLSYIYTVGSLLTGSHEFDHHSSTELVITEAEN